MEEVQQYFAKKRYTNEINDIDIFIKKYPNEKYDDVIQLKKELTNDLNSLSNKKIQQETKSNNELNNLFDKIDQKVQMQDWKKIPKYIQNDKIKEYVKLNLTDKSAYKDILSKIKAGKIKTSHIHYNQETCQIDSISNL